MKVRELIEKLSKFDMNLEVIISDGYKANFYSGKFQIEQFTDSDGAETLDIGVGGFDINK